MAYIKTPQNAYFEETPEGLKVVADPKVLKALQTGSIPSVAKNINLPTNTPLDNTKSPFETYGVEGASASFLAGMGDIMKKMGTKTEELATAYPKPEEEEVNLLEQKRLAEERTKLGYAITREEIGEQAEWSRRELERYREQFETLPMLSKRDVEAYTDKVEELHSKVSKQLERLELEEQNALDTLDYNYADQVRKVKLDYLNFQNQLLQNQFSILNNAFNIQNAVEERKRQQKADAQTQASNILNTVLSSYSGVPYDSLPQTVKDALETSTEILGIPLDAVRNLVSQKKANLDIVREGDYTSVYDKNTGERIARYYAPSGGFSSSEYLSDMYSTINKLYNENKGADGKLSAEDYYTLMDLWRTADPDSLKWFFVNYPVETYLGDTLDKIQRMPEGNAKNVKLQLYNQIQSIKDSLQNQLKQDSLTQFQTMFDAMKTFIEQMNKKNQPSE